MFVCRIHCATRKVLLMKKIRDLNNDDIADYLMIFDNTIMKICTTILTAKVKEIYEISIEMCFTCYYYLLVK